LDRPAVVGGEEMLPGGARSSPVFSAAYSPDGAQLPAAARSFVTLRFVSFAALRVFVLQTLSARLRAGEGPCAEGTLERLRAEQASSR
jgi:hypothetical protein